MRHIIALPYWCDKEINNFLQVLSRWDQLCRTKVEYSFLIARRFDAPESRELADVCSRHAPTRTVSCDSYQWTGWPAGANGMFRHVMEMVDKEEEKDGGFLFWFEHDVIPIYADWMDWLQRMWRPDLDVMGQYMSSPWINLHNVPMKPNINGTSCYGKSIARNPAFLAINREVCFDFTLSELLPSSGGRSMPLPLFQDLWFFMPDWVYRCDLTKLMINGAKELSQRERVIGYILKNRDDT